MQKLILYEFCKVPKKGFDIKDMKLPPFESITEANIYCANKGIVNYCLRDPKKDKTIFCVINDPSFGEKKVTDPGPRFCGQILKEGAKIIVPPVGVKIGKGTKANFWSESFIKESLERKEDLRVPTYCYYSLTKISYVGKDYIKLDALRISSNYKHLLVSDFEDSKTIYSFRPTTLKIVKENNKILFI